jgi:translation elongation factor EF-Ts
MAMRCYGLGWRCGPETCGLTSASYEQALEALRVKGLAQAGKKAGRIATEGLIAQYIHAGAR